jgi:hypothetical protein
VGSFQGDATDFAAIWGEARSSRARARAGARVDRSTSVSPVFRCGRYGTSVLMDGGGEFVEGVEPGFGGFPDGAAVARVGAVEEDESGFLGCTAGACAPVGVEGGNGGERVVAAVAVAGGESGPLGVTAVAGIDLCHGLFGHGFGIVIPACTVGAGQAISASG